MLKNLIEMLRCILYNATTPEHNYFQYLSVIIQNILTISKNGKIIENTLLNTASSLKGIPYSYQTTFVVEICILAHYYGLQLYGSTIAGTCCSKQLIFVSNVSFSALKTSTSCDKA